MPERSAAETLTRERHAVLHETITMALYISLSLLAVLLATPTPSEESATELALTVGLTAVALVIAHQVAFRLSTRLTHHGRLDEKSLQLLGAQAAGGFGVAVLATVPILVFGPSGLRVSAVLRLLLVALVGYLSARSVPVSRARALVYVGIVVVVVALVLILKGLVGH